MERISQVGRSSVGMCHEVTCWQESIQDKLEGTCEWIEGQLEVGHVCTYMHSA